MAIKIGTIDVTEVAVGETLVGSVAVGSNVVWQRVLPEPLCFTAVTANSTVHLDKVGSPNAISLQTSTDGTTWTDYNWTGTTGDTLTMTNIGDKVYFRAKNQNTTIGNAWDTYYKFIGTGSFAASGNIQSLLKSNGTRTDVPVNGYRNLFQGCASLTTAPELPATTLANGCYTNMFRECTSLTTAPDLPATTLADYCYSAMFQGCSSLTTAPALPATTLASSCYFSMFYNCSSLTTAPALPATTLPANCYQYMFYGCSRLSSITVGFSDWQEASTPTTNWVKFLAASGTFTCPSGLPDLRGENNIPTGWTKTDA